MHELSSFFSGFFDWSVTSNLLTYTFVQHALIAAVLLGLISGLIGPFIVMRQMSFSVHEIGRASCRERVYARV